MDDLRSTRLTSRTDNALARLAGQVPLLLGLTGLILAFVLLGGLRPDLALLGFLVMVGLVALLPRPVVHLTHTVEVPAIGPARQDVERELLHSMVEALGEPGLVLDSRGAVLHRNGAAARQYPNLQVGRVMTLVMRNPDLVAAIEGSQRSGEPRSFELHETVPSETWDRVMVAPIRRPDRDWFADENRQLLVTFQSLTDLKRVDALRTDFVANASHELRTPLASLIGFIDTLLGPAARDAEAREKFLGIMRGQADRMSRLIDDLLSLSRIEMHQHVRPTGSVDLSGLLREVREGLQIQAKAANLDVVLSLPHTPVAVTGDRGQLYEVFENLIDNAIKYGADGKTVEVTLTAVDRPGLHHMVSIIDHGPGVEPEHVPRMTERFYRIDAEASRRKKGTGLGLAIVKHIVQRHRGQMTIRSKPGEGLRVDVLLP
ncbi:sensor histidine kinase [Devosia sediminis]|uniref:histidine kinase n=1 Tax=Devosia sediminis TaxID=2798801 RepID=A0A934MMF8_9HYPH|nr:ATP-binding protein [Devosia sediminis]MBJ3786165.1 GHKL domain-containing protein [Devosia sediminis]